MKSNSSESMLSRRGFLAAAAAVGAIGALPAVGTPSRRIKFLAFADLHYTILSGVR